MNLQDGRVVSNFIVQALRNEPITIYGDGKQTRSFCFVDDLISGLVKLAFSKETLTGPINIGNPVEFTMIELALKIIELTNSKSELKHMSLPGDDPMQRKPDITLAKSELGWEPLVDLESGLKMTIKDFKTRINQN